MNKDSRVNIARKVLQDGKLPASATALKIDSVAVLSAFGVVYCYT